MNFHSSPATHVAHVKINVSDLDRSLEFYTQILGFQILDQTSESASLTTDGETSILSLHQPENAAAKSRTSGLYHFAILLPHRSDLAAITIRLAQLDIRFGSADHKVSEALYLGDPDGNGIEIYIDRPHEEWNWEGNRVEMTTDPLDFEGLLKDFDPSMEWNGMPAGTKMGHLHLHVSDIGSAVEFYTQGLGMEIVCDFQGQAAFMSTEKYHHHIAVNVWNGTGAPAPEENSVGLNIYELQYPDAGSRDEAAGRLKDLGYEVKSENGRMISIDPSGNKVDMTTA